MTPNLYEILGVRRGVCTADVVRAFRNKAKEHHPDAGGDRARFEEIVDAYNVLSDRDKRAAYDRDGTVDHTADNQRAQALGIIETLMAGILAEIDQGFADRGIYNDLVAKMREQLEARMVGIAGEVSKMTAAAERYDKFAQRFEASGETNYLRKMVEARASAIRLGLPRASAALALCDTALQILNEHSFVADQEPKLTVEVEQKRPYTVATPFMRIL